MGCAILLGFVLTTFCRPLLKKCHLAVDDEVELVDEKVGTYWECIPIAERKRWFAEELWTSRKLGIDTMGEKSRIALSTSKGKERCMKNAPNYEILSNMKYCQMF